MITKTPHTHTHTQNYLTELTGCVVSTVPGEKHQAVPNKSSATSTTTVDAEC
jgi:hypothetical protein